MPVFPAYLLTLPFSQVYSRGLKKLEAGNHCRLLGFAATQRTTGAIMFNIIAIMVGGSIGSICRHGMFLVVQSIAGPAFPAGTLAVNLLGSLSIGFLWSLFDESALTHQWRLFVFTGFLGAFTTFSTFTRETTQMLKVGAWKTAFSYVALSNILGILAVMAGYYLFQRLIMGK